MSQSTLGYSAIAITAMVLFAVLRANLRKARHQKLSQRFSSDEVASAIMRREIWQGMTAEMLQESRGKPDGHDQSVFKTKTKETWKYEKIGKNRYKIRVMLENRVVVGWK
jgi:ABC-type anion transport system duplicated permease subunit